MVVYNAMIILIIESECVCANYIPWSYWDAMMYHLVLWLCLPMYKTCSTIFMKFLVSSFILTQYVNLHARSFVFSIAMWLMCSLSSPCVFSISGIITCLAFMMIPSITAMSSLNDQYVLMSHCTWSLISGNPVMMYPFSQCKCSSHTVTCCICGIASVLHPTLHPCHGSLHLCFPHDCA